MAENLNLNGKLIIIVGTSGTGKSTMITRLKNDFKSLSESVSYTTRPMRKGEIDGVSYHFISKDKFDQMLKTDEFIEWAVVHDNYYGTSRKTVEDALKNGKHLLFDLDVQGADSMKTNFKNLAQAIFIAPPSVEELEKRLRNRGTENTNIINLRLNNAKRELLKKETYDYLIYNDEIERAYYELKTLTQNILNGK
jgi:guanylate kinase